MIYFVGAGPGAPDLITLRGAKLLEQADLVIYAGSLVNPALLDGTKKSCTIFNSASMTLEEVVQELIKAERQGLLAVRLHTGDPSLYGAIREQMDLLNLEGIAYEIVPGVSSFCGAAAAVKAEYTLPSVSQTVIITRMEGRTPVPKREKLATLAAHGATMVLFLSTGLLESVVTELLSGGYAAECPAAIVYKATWPDEKVIHTTVSKLAITAKEHNIEKTALILVGHFLGDVYDRSLLYHPNFTHEYRKGIE